MKIAPTDFPVATKFPRGPPTGPLPGGTSHGLTTTDNHVRFLKFNSVHGVRQMKLGISPQVPSGTHQATFEGVEATSHDEYGPGIRWRFRIDEGEYADKVVSRTTTDVATLNNLCGRFLAMVAGCSIQEACEQDTDAFVGVIGTIAVEPLTSGEGVRVSEFVRDDFE